MGGWNTDRRVTFWGKYAFLFIHKQNIKRLSDCKLWELGILNYLEIFRLAAKAKVRQSINIAIQYTYMTPVKMIPVLIISFFCEIIIIQ